MIHLKRFLWLLAWSVWVWLGFGLYRELPRDFGPAVCKLPLDDKEWPHGLIGDDLAVTRLKSDERNPERRRVWDVKARRLLYEAKTPDGLQWESMKWGVGVGLNIESWNIKPGEKAFQLLNYRTGEWTPLGMQDWTVKAAHASKPWIIIDATIDELSSIKDDGFPPLRLLVQDVTKNQTVFRWNRAISNVDDPNAIAAVWFRGDELALIVGHFDLKSQNYTSMCIERWNVQAKSRVSMAAVTPPSRFVTPSANGDRIILFDERTTTGASLTVLDTVTQERLFAAGDLDEGRVELRGHRPGRRAPWPSASGRAIITGFGNLWNTELHQEIWKRDPKLEFVYSGESSTTFQVREDWSNRLPKLEVFQNWSTIATREFDTGKLIFRRWANPEVRAVSPTGETAFTRDDVIHQMPPRVNYPLLALCQIILALPLILLWAVLRWRRKRKLRRAAE